MSASAEYDDLPPRNYPRSAADGCSLPISASTPSIAAAAAASSSKTASPAAPPLQPEAHWQTDSRSPGLQSDTESNGVNGGVGGEFRRRGGSGSGRPTSGAILSNADSNANDGGGDSTGISANTRLLVSEGMDAEAAKSALRISKNDLNMAREILRVFVPKQQPQQQRSSPQTNVQPSQQQQINAQRAREHYRN